MKKPSPKDARKEKTRKRLLELVKPGDTIYTILRHVSRSGMLRVIDLQIIKNDQLYWIGLSVAELLGYSYDDRKQGVRVGGGGMDMGFHLVYTLAYALFPDGFDCIGDRCPSNDHSNGIDRNHHKDGGCALRHRWI